LIRGRGEEEEDKNDMVMMIIIIMILLINLCPSTIIRRITHTYTHTISFTYPILRSQLNYDYPVLG